jgi:hypothetical protein
LSSMAESSRSFIDWCLATYAEKGWAGLKKRYSKAKYLEITAKLPSIEVCETLKLDGDLPPIGE